MGESDDLYDVEVEPQVDGPEDLEGEMDEPRSKPEEQEDVEDPREGSSGGVHWNTWLIDNWDQFDGHLDVWHFAEDVTKENVEIASEELMGEDK